MAGRKPVSPENRKGYKGKNLSIFFKNVRSRRIDLGLDQKTVAQLMGIVPSRVSELEGGKFFDDPDRIIALARALKTTPDYLFGFRDEP